MPTYHILTPEDKRTILRLNSEGNNNGVIAVQIGCTTNTARVFLASKGIKSPDPPHNPGNITKRLTPQIVEQYRQDKPMRAIAKDLNIPYHIVVNAIFSYRMEHDDLPYRNNKRYHR